MKYVLKENLSLRSWDNIPYAVQMFGNHQLSTLSKCEFELLTKCDGETDLPPNGMLDLLCESGYCKVAQEGEKITPWQKPRVCNNRYFYGAYWAITGKCNYNCKHCFMAADNAPMMSEFSLEQCITMLDELEKCGIQKVDITGGEPTLHPHFMTILKECVKRRILVSEILTNGSLVTREMLQEIKDIGLDPLIKVSFDGLGHHDWLRGKKGAEAEAISAIRLATEMGFKVWANMNIHRGNVDTIMPTIRLMDEMGVQSLRMIRTSEAPRWAENSDGLCFDMAEYYELGLKIAQQCIDENISLNIHIWRFVNFNGKSKVYYMVPAGDSACNYSDNDVPCHVIWHQVAIAPEGDIAPCNQMSGQMKADGIMLGNVHQKPLQECLREGAYIDCITTTVKEIHDKNERCQACSWWNRCRGGCRASALVLTRKIDGYDPFKCIYFEGGFMEKTQALFDAAGFRCTNP